MDTLQQPPTSTEYSPLPDDRGAIGLSREEQHSFEQIAAGFDEEATPAASEAPSEAPRNNEIEKHINERVPRKLGRYVVKAVDGLYKLASGQSAFLKSAAPQTFNEGMTATASRSEQAPVENSVEKSNLLLKRLRGFGSAAVNRVFGIPSSDSEYYRQKSGAER